MSLMYIFLEWKENENSPCHYEGGMQKIFFCDHLTNFSCQKEEGVHKNLSTDHQSDSFKNSYSDNFYLLERQAHKCLSSSVDTMVFVEL